MKERRCVMGHIIRVKAVKCECGLSYNCYVCHLEEDHMNNRDPDGGKTEVVRP